MSSVMTASTRSAPPGLCLGKRRKSPEGHTAQRSCPTPPWRPQGRGPTFATGARAPSKKKTTAAKHLRDPNRLSLICSSGNPTSTYLTNRLHVFVLVVILFVNDVSVWFKVVRYETRVLRTQNGKWYVQ